MKATPTGEDLGRVFFEHGGKVLYEAIPKARILHGARQPNVLYGGAAGGSKSTSLRWHAHIACLDYPGLRVLFIRRFSTELEATHLMWVTLDLPRKLGRLVGNQFKYHNGSVMLFGHCNDVAAFAKLLSTEWDIIIIDEATELQPDQLQLIATRTGRSKHTTGQVLLGTNPGGPGHHYVYTHFISKEVDLEEEPGYEPDEWLFIYADFNDNPHIDQAKYRKRLLALTDPYQQRRFFGDWELPSGNLFEEVEKRWHLSHEAGPWTDSRRVVVADWGWDAWAPAVWFESDAGLYGPARHRAYREWYPRTIVPALWAAGVVERSGREGIERVILDEAAWGTPQDGGPSIAEQMMPVFQRARIPLVPSVKGKGSIATGVQTLHSYLWTAQGRIQPLLTIHDSCKRLWNDLVTVQRGDFMKGQDPDCPAPKQKQLHGIDVLRYFVASRPEPAALSIEARLQMDRMYQQFHNDARTLEAAFQERARKLGVRTLKVKDLKVKQRQYPWKG